MEQTVKAFYLEPDYLSNVLTRCRRPIVRRCRSRTWSSTTSSLSLWPREPGRLAFLTLIAVPFVASDGLAALVLGDGLVCLARHEVGEGGAEE